MLRLNLWSYPRAFCCTGPTGATSTRLSLRPPFIERVKREAKLGQILPRERGLASPRYLTFESQSLPRRPGLDPGPITTGRSDMLRCNRLLAPQHLPVVMGPRVREDDSDARRARIVGWVERSETHHSRGLLHRDGFRSALPILRHNHFSTIHAGAWSLAPSSPLMSRSTPAFVRRGASVGLSRR
jgi:hypothetical protein